MYSSLVSDYNGVGTRHYSKNTKAIFKVPLKSKEKNYGKSLKLHFFWEKKIIKYISTYVLIYATIYFSHCFFILMKTEIFLMIHSKSWFSIISTLDLERIGFTDFIKVNKRNYTTTTTVKKVMIFFFISWGLLKIEIRY